MVKRLSYRDSCLILTVRIGSIPIEQAEQNLAGRLNIAFSKKISGRFVCFLLINYGVSFIVFFG
jgi:hypothetical protein